MKSDARRYTFLALGLIGLAFALRLWGLTATSLWYDETFMLDHARQGVGEAVAGLLREDNALPLHGLLLALWIEVAGSGEFAARYLSVLLGTATLPLLLRLGGALSGRRCGGWGAALAFATLPIHVYYAQEVRMYALAILLAAAFAWSSWRVTRLGRGVVPAVASGAGMMVAHLYAGLLWAAVLLWGAILWGVNLVRRRRDPALPPFPARAWLRTHLLLALLALPVAAWALWRARVDATAVSAIPTETLRWLPLLFGVGQYLPAPWGMRFAALALLSLAAGAAALLRARRWEGALWIALGLVVPLTLLLGATLIKAKWSERYLLPSFGLTLVVGVGLGWELPLGGIAGRRARWALRGLGFALALGWLALAGPALYRQAQGTWAVGVRDEWHPKPDFRGVAAWIAEHDAPDDAIAVVGGYAAHTLAYYYDGPATIFGLPSDARLLDTRHPVDLAALERLEDRAGESGRLWLLLWQEHLADPTALVQSTLVASCRRLPVSRSFTNVGLLLFDLATCPPLDEVARPPHPLDARFAAPIRLTGYDLQRAGESWVVILWWAAEGPLVEDYSVFVHLLGPEGDLVAQHDHIAGADAYPTGRWAPGTRLRDRFFLAVPGGACPGCRLQVGLYTSAGRLSLDGGGDSVTIPLEGTE